jgi:hypothetical protein
MSEPPDTDQQAQDALALQLRARGRSYGTIAKRPGMEKTWLAVAAFNRALRRQERREQHRIREQESTRLTKLQATVEQNDALDSRTRQRQLAVVERLRVALFSDADPPVTTEP